MSDAELRLLALERLQSRLNNAKSMIFGRDLEWLEQRQHVERALELLLPVRHRRVRISPRSRGNLLRHLPMRAQCHIYEFDCTYRYVYNLTLLNFELLCQEFSSDEEDEGGGVGGGLVHRILEVSRVCSYFDIDVSSGIAWRCQGCRHRGLRSTDSFTR